ncbi:hypothetical protein D3C85_1074510 [compost metagenome]
MKNFHSLVDAPMTSLNWLIPPSNVLLTVLNLFWKSIMSFGLIPICNAALIVSDIAFQLKPCLYACENSLIARVKTVNDIVPPTTFSAKSASRPLDFLILSVLSSTSSVFSSRRSPRARRRSRSASISAIDFLVASSSRFAASTLYFSV